MFKTTLFKALETAAKITVSGLQYELIKCHPEGKSTDHYMLVSPTGTTDIHIFDSVCFPDQEIEINDQGIASAQNAYDAEYFIDPELKYEFQFIMNRPINADDVK